jgi:hypothetical protein
VDMSLLKVCLKFDFRSLAIILLCQLTLAY